MTVKRLQDLLIPCEDKSLGELARRASDYGRLADALRARLDPAEARGLLAANIHDDGEMIVLASSPAWAARLRFLSDELLDAARETGAEVVSCRVRVSRG